MSFPTFRSWIYCALSGFQSNHEIVLLSNEHSFKPFVIYKCSAVLIFEQDIKQMLTASRAMIHELLPLYLLRISSYLGDCITLWWSFCTCSLLCLFLKKRPFHKTLNSQFGDSAVLPRKLHLGAMNIYGLNLSGCTYTPEKNVIHNWIFELYCRLGLSTKWQPLMYFL